jgi:hypothetical protein
MEKVPGEELIHLSVIKICRRKRGCGRLWMIWLSIDSENWWKCGKGEGHCENRLSFRHQHDRRVDEYRQRNDETSFNDRSEHEKCSCKKKNCSTFQYNSISKRTSVLCSYMFHTESSSGLHTKPLKHGSSCSFLRYTLVRSPWCYFF